MGTEKPASALASIRTFASDLARSQKNPSAPVAPGAPRVPKTPDATIVGTGESRTYQAPTWKKTAVHHTDTKKEKVVPPPTPAPAPTLKPLVGPKKVEETTIVVDNEDAASATIIRDTKHDRFRLFPAIISSLKNWFVDVKEQYFTKKTPKYTVPETTRRKGVIQKATSKTGKLATFDNTSLQARIKEREVKASPKEPSTIWTANTEPGYPLLEAPDKPPAVSNVQVVPRRSFRTEPPTAMPPVAQTPVVIETAVAAPTAEETPAQPRVIVASETEPIIDTAPVNPPPSPIEESTVPPPTKEQAAAVVPKPVTNTRPNSLREWVFAVNTNLVALALAGFVLLMVIIGVSGYRWFNTNVATIEVVTTPNHPTYLTAPLQTLATADTREQLFTTLIENQKNSGGQLLLFAFTTTAAGDVLTGPAALMSRFNFTVSTPFARSLDALYFGITKTQTPFILLKTTDNNTALGGMLNWEAALYADLAPMLEAYGETDSDTDATFKDITVNGIDARALVSANNRTLLVYNQPINNTIIITADPESLNTLLSLID